MFCTTAFETCFVQCRNWLIYHRKFRIAFRPGYALELRPTAISFAVVTSWRLVVVCSAAEKLSQ
jgi:hypothetical protein